jgi:hypothetical protein
MVELMVELMVGLTVELTVDLTVGLKVELTVKLTVELTVKLTVELTVKLTVEFTVKLTVELMVELSVELTAGNYFRTKDAASTVLRPYCLSTNRWKAVSPQFQILSASITTNKKRHGGQCIGLLLKI